MKIFTGSAHPDLAQRIAGYLKTDLGEVEITKFPDGEIHRQVHGQHPGEGRLHRAADLRPPNENLMELLIMMDAMPAGVGRPNNRGNSLLRICAPGPEGPAPCSHHRQAGGESAGGGGGDRMLAMDLHAQQIQGFFDIPVDHLYAMPVMVRHLRERNLSDIVVVSPDSGGVKMAIAYAQMLGAGFALGAKYRRGATEVEAMNVVGEVDGRTCVMVDDLTSTAGDPM